MPSQNSNNNSDTKEINLDDICPDIGIIRGKYLGTNSFNNMSDSEAYRVFRTLKKIIRSLN